MAIRLDASGDILFRTTNLPSSTLSLTACCWYYHVSSRLAYSYIISIEGGGPYWETGFAGTDPQFEADNNVSSNAFGITPGNGTWWFVAQTYDGSSFHTSHIISGATGVMTSISYLSSSFTPSQVSFGSDLVDEWVNGRIYNAKLYDANFTTAEIYQEAMTLRPQRTANLNGWWPMFPGASERLLDYSGNGRNLSSGGTLTDEDPAPISWGAPILIHISIGGNGYSRGNYVSLPTDDSDLETAYTAQDVIDVGTNNNVRVGQLAAGEYAIHLYKDSVGINSSVTLTWEGQTDYATTASTVYLQIYNRNSASWETVDSDNTTGANTDFTLTANIPDVTNYKDGANIIASRIYQQSV